MKVHYINILFFAVPLNILVKDQSNYNTPKRTPNSQLTKSHRSLCECELYAPANYDSDPQMKDVMENFNKQTQQRFQEYDERMQSKRKQCKDKCDKEIQKIILKDKLEKELMDKFATLHTDIQSEAIPTCVCEKSIADKVEKGCLRCGYGLGTVAPTVGLFGSVAVHVWKPLALKSAIAAAKQAGALAGKAAGDAYGMEAVIGALKHHGVHTMFPDIFKSILKINHYTEVTKFSGDIVTKYGEFCTSSGTNGAKCAEFHESFGLWDPDTSGLIGNPSTEIQKTINSVVRTTKTAADKTAAKMTATKTAEFEVAKKGIIEAASYDWYATVGYSVLAIVIIILIMVIIYLILRYRRKKKMKKKLQYIKLLDE
ncbi:rifin PIR protein, putative [Plasmodium reichenowi]|uniref:Rifin PIR protein, putative n=1 Tax=Plasmodium reichenowi TaxID=5854 RepID=A0A2P9DT11_PLARE|nr:rifin PIR protein, putative [Plasmodium reichenowi]